MIKVVEVRVKREQRLRSTYRQRVLLLLQVMSMFKRLDTYAIEQI